MVRVVADDPPGAPTRSTWRVTGTVPYACIALPGRRCTDVLHERDRNWPFMLGEDIDDDTLVSVVIFIRSMPQLQLRDFSTTVGARPIEGIFQKGDAILVSFRMAELTTERITLMRKDGQWVMTDYGMVIV